MIKRFVSRLYVPIVAIAISLATASAASAGITASAVCDANTGTFVISYEARTNRLGVAHSNVQILFNDVLVAVGEFTATDNDFSGSAPAPAASGPGDAVVVGWHAVGDWADGSPGGDSAAITINLPIEPCGQQTGLGRFTGGGHQVRVGEARVTRGLTIHCDLLLSNNLEINWGGNSFHMTEHLTTVACTDSPEIVQFPPAAPLDTLIGVGTGRYNNVNGYTVEFTLQDHGEPGENDKMAIRIYETANPANVVLNIPLQLLSGGNLQAHYDQPHK